MTDGLTLKCHAERSEESRSGSGRSEDEKIRARFFASLRMTANGTQDDGEWALNDNLPFNVYHSLFYCSLFSIHPLLFTIHF